MSSLVEKCTEFLKSKNQEQELFLFLMESTDSTMLEARRIEEQVAKGGSLPAFNFSGHQVVYSSTADFLVFSFEQTLGKGRENRAWHSAHAAGLYLTFVFYPDNKALRLEGLSEVIALAVVRALERFGIKSFIKRPNDVMCVVEGKARKIAGILVDARSSGDALKSLHIGLGLNVKRQVFPDNVPGVSMEELLLEELDLVEVFLELVSELIFCAREFFERGLLAFERDIERSRLVGDRSAYVL